MPLAAAGPIRGVSARTSSPQFKVGSFTMTTLATSDRTIVTGVGFRPLAVMVWFAAYSSTEGSWITSNIRHIIGLASDRYAGYAQYHSNHNAAQAAVEIGTADGFLYVTNGTTTATGTLVSRDDDGFTIGWDTTLSGVTNVRAYYIAFGGFGSKFTTTNTQFLSTNDVVVDNLDFTPQALFHLFAHSSGLSIGAATATSAQWAVSGYSQNLADPTNTVRLSDDDAILVTSTTSGGASSHEANLQSLDANGFTISQSANGGLASGTVLAGGSLNYAKAGSFTKAGVTGSQAVTGLGFQPKLLLLSSAGRGNNDTPSDHVMISLGAATSSSEQACTLIADEDNQATTDARAYQSSSACILIGDVPGTVRAQASLTSMDSDGFTLNWSTNDATVNSINYLALA